MSAQIPTYPLKTELTFDHQETIQQFHQSYTPLVSSTSFSNLFILDTSNETRLSFLNENLLITQQVSPEEMLVTIVGNNDMIGTIDQIKKTESAVVELWGQQDQGVEDLANAEYLYDIKNTINKEGQEYASFRRKLNVVSKMCPDLKLTLLSDPEPLWNLAYPGQKQTDDTQLILEQEAFEKMLMFRDRLPLKILGINNGSKLIAFTIVEKLNEHLMVIHFFKSEHEITGLAEMLFYLVAQMYQSECRYLNFQQDLDISGLRQFKRSLRPSTLIIPRVLLE